MVIFAVAFVGLLCVFRCTPPLDIADGGASGTDVGLCKVVGKVLDTLNQPVAEGLIRLRPFDYIAGMEGEEIIKRDIYSDNDGVFMFDSVPRGHYTVECLSTDSLGQVVDCIVDSVDTVTILPYATLLPMASITGKFIGIKPEGVTDRSVNVIGLERTALVDNEGNFRLNTPGGWCRLNLHGIDPDNPDIDTLLYLRPGESKRIEPVPRRIPPCESLACELKEIRGILDSNGITSVDPESAAVIIYDHVVELRLRGLELKFLPLSICRISRLRVIDIGNNRLKELPFTLKLLRNLEELRADSNEIWMIDASISAIKSLRVLDLSFNKLQSLPEPIIYLSPAYLDLSGNMLCNIGEATRRWINTYDPDWEKTQICR